MVIVLLKSESTDDLTFCRAAITLGICSSPFFPISFNAPTLTPRPSAIACASPGVCSITELSSAPRNSPLAIACPNCINAASAEAELAPDIATAFETVSVNSATSAWLIFNVSAFFAKR